MCEPAVRGAPAYADVVDLDRYPIDDLDGPRGRTLVRACREELGAKGACSLPGFLTARATAAMVALAGRLAPQAWASDQLHTPYFEPVDPGVGAADPRARQVRSAKRGIAYDRIPADAPLRRLYEADDLTVLVAAVLGRPVLYRSADPLDAAQITAFGRGDELGWHFDRSEFSVTLMYQPADAGGHFEYVPALRSGDDDNYAGVQRVLDATAPATAADADDNADDNDIDDDDENDNPAGAGVVRLPSLPGTLAIFHGRNALHRVTPVRGTALRINSVLTYGDRPDMKLNALTSRLFYGRTS